MNSPSIIPPADDQADLNKQRLKVREAVAFSMFAMDNYMDDPKAMATWRADGEVRKKYKTRASDVMDMLETFGVRHRVSSSKSLDVFLQELVTIPAAPAYSIEDDDTKNELPNATNIG